MGENPHVSLTSSQGNKSTIEYETSPQTKVGLYSNMHFVLLIAYYYK